jgi:hypothetical protein
MSLAASTFVRDVRGALTRPYRVTLPMIALVALVPLYIFIGVANIGRTHYTPAIGIDRLIPLVPAWSMAMRCSCEVSIARPGVEAAAAWQMKSIATCGGWLH